MDFINFWTSAYQGGELASFLFPVDLSIDSMCSLNTQMLHWRRGASGTEISKEITSHGAAWLEHQTLSAETPTR